MKKRIFDIICASILIIVSSPLFLMISCIILFIEGRPVFYMHERIGKNWKKFKIIKFRTMTNNLDGNNAEVTSENNERITKIGRFLRKYKIDEIPQFFNVLLGDMSIVGPRPEVYKYAVKFKSDYDQLLKVKPGITDTASLKFRHESSFLKDADDVEKV